MRLLIDTHVFLWYISGSDRLPARFQNAIANSENEVYLSVASIWECVIKHTLGKLPLPEAPAVYLPRQRIAHRIQSLPIEEDDMSVLAGLAPHHRDPFDRLLIAQAQRHGLVIVTVDPLVQAYDSSFL